MNIFVAKLDYNTSVETVQALFEEFGTVTSAKIIMDKETGRSKGYGFVEMEDEEEGWNAIRALNGTEVDGREILCKKSEPKENSRGRDNRGGGGGNRRRFNDNRGGGYGDRRNNDRRGGYNDRNNDNRGGGYDRDRRGGYDRNDRSSNDRRSGGYDRDRRSSYDRNDRNDRWS